MSIARRLLVSSLAALAAAMSAASSSPFLDDPRWQVSVSGVQVSSTVEVLGGSYEGYGVDLGLSYRLSDRFGIGVTAIDHDVQDTFGIVFFEPLLEIETSYRATWLLARADFHLTPHRRVDLILSPLVGFESTRDLEERVRFELPGGPAVGSTVEFESENDLAWGARLALDIPLGRTPGRSSLSVGATFLHSHVEAAARVGGDLEETLEFDLEPIALHVGYAYRF